ncbi:hypothetical protein N0V93_007139 [Gnomoniopsis smithogilvyi]|uniref:ABC transporter domain-containing protein n=1 Tax=Gnomoniopsis smithogilvyi TaxID=1191159 RepID=A0A9W8YPI7_9PEZI|nr:hypothetical protein N0V93_007139 [Gnomoniopsis smithogilvyi]
MSKTVSAGAMGVAFLNAVTLGETLTQLIIAWTGLETSLGAIARIELLQRRTPVEMSEVLNPASPGRGAGGCGAIRFENVWVTYSADAGVENAGTKAEWSLRGVSLDIQPGERIALCGKTGSGKSTLHLALLRMVNIPAGSILIDGVDHATMSLEALRSRFLVISQDRLKSFSTLRQEIDPHEAFSDLRIEAVLLECGVLDAVRNTPGGLAAHRADCKFSNGEEQLLSVARVILEDETHCKTSESEDKIVLLDEITSSFKSANSIDYETEKRVESLLRSHLRTRTLIAINHKLEAVMEYDRVVVLEDGRVKDIGTPAELLLRCELFAKVE